MINVIKSFSMSCFIFFFFCLVTATSAQIKNWQTGQIIPGTENITPGPTVNLAYWNSNSKNLKYADFSGGLNL